MPDATQGVQLATMQKLAQYWATEHDWRKCEAKINALPNFITEIDGLDIHFIHVRSKHEHALPIIITHGWPGSIIEQMKVIAPLTDPTAHGGTEADAFHVVIPSLPGYGFSGKPTKPGWNPVTIAKAWATLMQRLGYTKYVAQGGDWGNAISEVMALQQPPGLLGIHTNMAATVPPDVSKALSAGGPPPAGLSPEEKHAWDQLDDFYKNGLGYAHEMNNRPQTLYGLADSPVGLAGWILDHDIRSYQMIVRVFDGKPEGLSRDDVLDNITLYWLTNTAVSSARLYWDTAHNLPPGGFFDVRGVKLPVGVSAFAEEIYQAPKSWSEKAYVKLALLRQPSRRHAFRGLGTARAIRVRSARDLQNAAHMKPLKLISMAILIAGGISMSHDAQAQQPATTARRTSAARSQHSRARSRAVARRLRPGRIVPPPPASGRGDHLCHRGFDRVCGRGRADARHTRPAKRSRSPPG